MKKCAIDYAGAASLTRLAVIVQLSADTILRYDYRPNRNNNINAQSLTLIDVKRVLALTPLLRLCRPHFPAEKVPLLVFLVRVRDCHRLHTMRNVTFSEYYVFSKINLQADKVSINYQPHFRRTIAFFVYTLTSSCFSAWVYGLGVRGC